MTSVEPAIRLAAVLGDDGDDLVGRLGALAIDLRDAEHMDQRTMFTLFQRALSAADADDDAVRDALEHVIDRVSGWCEPRQRIFPEP